MLECVFCLEFVASVLSTPVTDSVEAGLDCPVHLPLSPGVGVHMTAGPLPQSPELFVTTLVSILTAPPNGLLAWSSTCWWVHCHSWFMSPTCRITRVVLILSISRKWTKSLGTGESLDLHLGFDLFLIWRRKPD